MSKRGQKVVLGPQALALSPTLADAFPVQSKPDQRGRPVQDSFLGSRGAEAQAKTANSECFLRSWIPLREPRRPAYSVHRPPATIHRRRASCDQVAPGVGLETSRVSSAPGRGDDTAAQLELSTATDSLRAEVA